MTYYKNIKDGLSLWRDAKGRRTLVVNGDSVGCGLYADIPTTEGFVSLLYNYYTNLYGVDNSYFIDMLDSDWVKAGAWVNYQYTGIFQTSQVSNEGGTASYTADCIGFTFYYRLLSLTRAFTIQIDDEAPISVGGVYSSGNDHQYYAWEGSSGTHTITITSPNSAYVVCCCALEVIKNTSGVCLLNACVSGTKLPNVPYNSYLNGVMNPLSIVEYTLNDFLQQTAINNYELFLQSFVEEPIGSQMILALHERNRSLSIPQSTYDAICNSVADISIAYINIHEHWGTWSSANAKGWMYDETHLTTLGHYQLSRDIIEAIESYTPINRRAGRVYSIDNYRRRKRWMP